MSGKLKEVRGRIKSVISTQQITKAMKMVAAAKLRRATEAIIQMRPYSEKLSGILSNLLASMEGDVSVAYAQSRTPEKVLLVVVTSDRGLCGGFNTNTIKLTQSIIAEKYADQEKAGNLKLMCVGKKGYEFFQRRGYSIIDTHVDLFSKLQFEHVVVAAEEAMDGFVDGTYDAIEIIYGQFKNAAVQNFIAEPFLPVAAVEGTKEEGEEDVNADYIYSPSKQEIVEELIPKILKTQFYKALLDSNASEHGARMTAMDKATENAQELLRELKISYNKERQAAITTELSEIVSGAAAMEG